MMKIVVFGRGNDGHRAEYYALLERELQAAGHEVEITDRVMRLWTARRVFFAMIDEALPAFVFMALLSLVTRARVAGFLFRAGECFKPGPKYLLKRAIFMLLRRLPTVGVLTIMPFSIAPHFTEIASGWVNDPQFWDLQPEDAIDPTRTTALAEEVRRSAGERRVLVALGAQNLGKGFDYLAELWTSSEEFRNRFLVVTAGKVSESSKVAADRLRSTEAMVVDRFISAEELLSLYGVADLVWGAYHPIYDQASGITGRAYQLGKTVILRRGSFMSRLMASLQAERLEIGYDDAKEAIETILFDREPLTPHGHVAAMEEMRRHFRSTIAKALLIESKSTGRER